MNEEQILNDLTRILRDLLGDDSLTLQRDTVRADIPAWDSFQYVNFIVATELEYGIKFRVADVESFTTVGDIVAEIQTLAV